MLGKLAKSVIIKNLELNTSVLHLCFLHHSTLPFYNDDVAKVLTPSSGCVLYTMIVQVGDDWNKEKYVSLLLLNVLSN